MHDQYAVFGNPIEHSRSPMIHREFARQTGQPIDYRRERVPLGEFAASADRFFAGGGLGLNVTLPFKEDAYHYAERLTDRAVSAGAVNTLSRRDDGSILGDNSDGIGLVRDLRDNLRWKIRGQRILMMGAGGAVRGALEPLLAEKPEHLVIVNRTLDKALALAKLFAEQGYLLGCDYSMLEGQQFDVVINGTSASLQGDQLVLPETLLGSAEACCYDMMYAVKPTDFMSWSAGHGGRVSDGAGMLVEQAAESFFVWRGVRPRTDPVLQALRDALIAS